MSTPRWTGCPCGCQSKPPYIDDPDCIRHRPLPRPRQPQEYDVVTLGLVPHNRDTCQQCRTVGQAA